MLTEFLYTTCNLSVIVSDIYVAVIYISNEVPCVHETHARTVV